MEIDVRSQNSAGDPHDHGYNDASRERARLLEIRAQETIYGIHNWNYATGAAVKAL